MDKPNILEKPDNRTMPQATSNWVGLLTSDAPADFMGFSFRVVAGQGRSKKLYLGNKVNSAPPLSAERAGCGVIFDGVLYNSKELQRELEDSAVSPESNEAETILDAYERWGESVLSRLRGAFALVIWDGPREVLFGLRDPIGTFPMFYTKHNNDVMLSPSTDALLAQPSTSREVNRAVLADFFIYRYPRLEETFFEAVNRIPPGHVLRWTRSDLRWYRYWDPAPGDTVNWLKPEELERFDELLDQAVTRCLRLGSPGIFLSGGLDSVSVAAFAAHRAAAEGIRKPIALSLIFPDSDVNEEIVQRGVADQLGMPHVIKPFFEAAGTKGLLAAAIGMNDLLPAPILNTWLPAYHTLAREGRARGCQTILTGQGGDEWFSVTQMLAADLLRDLNLKGVYELWKTARLSFRRSKLALLRATVWTFGLGPLVIPPLHRFAKRYVPSLVKKRREIFAPLPEWVAPDPSLRRQLQSRWEQKGVEDSQRASGSLYLRELKISLDHSVASWEMEEQFKLGQMTGVRLLHPIWDPDLVDLLYRTPPFLLIRDGRTKGLVRDSLARRFPNLGFEYQRKVEATRFYSSCIYREANDVWQDLGGGRTLGNLGVVDAQSLRPAFERLLEKRKIGDAHRTWSILNLESWARAHTS